MERRRARRMTSMTVLSSSPWLSTKAMDFRFPSASLTFLTGSHRSGSVSLVVPSNSSSPGLLHCPFLSSSSLTSPSLFSGLSLNLDFKSNNGARHGTGRRSLVVRAGKAALCQTKRNRSRKSLARTHGFRRRMRTTSGRAVLKRRRQKGRKVLCTKSNPNSGKRA